MIIAISFMLPLRCRFTTMLPLFRLHTPCWLHRAMILSPLFDTDAAAFLLAAAMSIDGAAMLLFS